MLVTVRDYNTLNHLRWTLENTDTGETDVVVMEARLTGYGSADRNLAMEQISATTNKRFSPRQSRLLKAMARPSLCWWFPPAMSGPQLFRRRMRWSLPPWCPAFPAR